jgi:hypothetical protein
MEWLKEQLNNPIFLLAIAVVIIAVWFMYGKGKTA